MLRVSDKTATIFAAALVVWRYAARLSPIALAKMPPAADRSVHVPSPDGVDATHWQALGDPTGNATLGEVLERRERFQDILVSIPHYGDTASAYWFHLSVQNRRHERQEAATFYLNVKHPMSDDVTLCAGDAADRRAIRVSIDRQIFGRCAASFLPA
jgi:hypothetical protein